MTDKTPPAAKKVTVNYLKEAKKSKQKLTMLTAYDYPMAAAADAAGVDMLLVGDSLAMVVLGYEDTLSVTMDDMIHHTKPVARAAKRALVIGDMPFMSYQIDKKEAMRNAGRFIQEGGAGAVKLEGGEEITGTVKAIVDIGVPVIGHLGLTPQSVNVFGGYGLQAKGINEAKKLITDAQALEEAGASAIVLEKVPAPVAKAVTAAVAIPTIGIGAGPDCDGQVLVAHDLLGLFTGFTPKFAKRYAELGQEMKKAFDVYVAEVKSGKFPAAEHSFPADPEVVAALKTKSSRTRAPKRES
jgi:3-methyl-2-oxobutanoate hydroxymethyltransferase